MIVLNIIICFAIIYYISRVMDLAIQLWQHMPLTEEPSTPLYITKVIE